MTRETIQTTGDAAASIVDDTKSADDPQRVSFVRGAPEAFGLIGFSRVSSGVVAVRPHRQRVIRRLTGVLLKSLGETSRVVFKIDEKYIEYSLPSRPLESAGIKLENQPFEMDEVEEPRPDGGFLVGYVYRSMAKQEDAFIEALDLDAEQIEKRKIILESYGDAAL